MVYLSHRCCAYPDGQGYSLSLRAVVQRWRHAVKALGTPREGLDAGAAQGGDFSIDKIRLREMSGK